MTATAIAPHRLTVITGHYGTGKTEFAVNLSFALAAEGERTALADLDIVNPYFRSRERRKELEGAGIRVICTSQSCVDADVPSIPAEVLSILEDRSWRGVLDIGGDPVGARVLARFQPYLLREDCQMMVVLNGNRPEVRDPGDAVRYLRGIEEVTGLRCTALVNNTHLCGQTDVEEIKKGIALAEEVSRLTGLPVACHVVERRLVRELEHMGDLGAPIFPISIQMKKPWE